MRVEKSYMPNTATLGGLRDALDEIIAAEGEDAVISHLEYSRDHVVLDRWSVRCHIYIQRES